MLVSCSEETNVPKLCISAVTFRAAGVKVVPESSDTLPYRLGGPGHFSNIGAAAIAPGRGLHGSARARPRLGVHIAAGGA